MSFSNQVETQKKPIILRKLENYFRKEIDHSLELVAEKLKDTSPLRRL